MVSSRLLFLVFSVFLPAILPTPCPAQKSSSGKPPVSQLPPATQPAPAGQLPPASLSPSVTKLPPPAKLSIAQMKIELEKSPNPVLYAKQVLQKRFSIDTIVVTRTRTFNSLADSLAYKGKEKKVYGPYGTAGKRFLVQILTKAPNLFYHIDQIFIDTAVFRRRMADSLGNMIIQKTKNDPESFGQLAQTYSMGGEAVSKGDIGWIARGSLLPQIEHEISTRKKGEVFKVWSANGLHIIRKKEDPKQDTGFALMMRVFL